MEPEQPAKRKRGRPSSGVPRKEQILKAVRKHRSKARFAGGELVQVELPRGLSWSVREIARRDGLTHREAMMRLLERGWREDYVARAKSEEERLLHGKTADAMIAQWRKLHEEGLQDEPAS